MSDRTFKITMAVIVAVFLVGMTSIVRSEQQVRREFEAGCALRFRAATTPQDSARVLDRHPSCDVALRPPTPTEDPKDE